MFFPKIFRFKSAIINNTQEKFLNIRGDTFQIF